MDGKRSHRARLTLKKETLRRLSDESLRRVFGGLDVSACCAPEGDTVPYLNVPSRYCPV